MSMKRKMRSFLSLFLAALLLVGIPAPTATQAEQKGEFQLSLGAGEDGHSNEGVTVAIFQVAIRDTSSATGWRVYEPFKDISVIGLNRSREFDSAYEKLSDAIHAIGYDEYQQSVADENGFMRFTDLDSGYYYGELVKGNENIGTLNFLVGVPMRDPTGKSDEPIYVIDINPKIEKTAPTPPPTYTPEPSEEPTPTVAPTPTEEPSPTPEPTPTVEPTPTITPPPEPPTPAPTETPEPTVTPEPVVPPGPGPGPRPTATEWPTAEPTPEVTATPEPTPEITPEPTPAPTEPAQQIPQSTPTPDPHRLTVYYIYWDGRTAYPTHQETLWPNEAYNVASPTIARHHCSLRLVSGVMPNHDVVYTVIYMPYGDGTEIIEMDDYETPLGLGHIIMHVGVCYE